MKMKLMAWVVALALAGGAEAADKKTASSFYEAGLTVSPVVFSRTTDFKSFDQGGGLRADFDFTANLGLTVEATGNDTRGLLVDDGFAGLRYGLPRGKARPYVIAGIGYRFGSDDPFLGYGVGFEYRLNPNTSLRLEARGEKVDDRAWTALFLAGLGWSF